MAAAAYMLITTAHGKIDEVSERLMKFKEIDDIHQIYGPWDIIVKIKTKTMADLRDFLEKVRQVKDVTGTETLIASDVF